LVRYIVLGSSGFIGSEFAKQIAGLKCEYLFMDRSLITVSINDEIRSIARSKNDIWHDLYKFLHENTIVVNCMWSKIDSSLNNAASHLISEKNEIEFIQELAKENCKYVSFGSIKEYESDSLYANSKRNVYDFISAKLKNYYWLRIANCYGSTNTNRLIDQLFNSHITGSTFLLDNPEKIINIYPVQQLVSFCINSVFDLPSGDYNIASQQWVKLKDINRSFVELTEPQYLNMDNELFLRNDSKLLRIHAPLLVDHFKALKSN
jgi:hypothetical protein